MAEKITNNHEQTEVSDDVNDQNHKEDAKNKENDSINSDAIERLLESTGYQILQENGQRRYCPKEWTKYVPERGCEIFVGKLPRDCFEDELIPVLQRAGQIYECRIMIDFDKKNRGFCFVTYATKDEAKTAVRDLNNYEIREKRYIGLCHSVDNCRLFVGGIPLDKKEEEVAEAMKQNSEGVVKAIVYSSATDKTKNRGFAFVEYESHKMAAHARRKLMKSNLRLWGIPVAVDWAEPEVEVDEEVMSKVKILYVRNLMPSTTEEKIFNIIVDILVQIGKEKKNIDEEKLIEKVKKLKDFAFVHFKNREDALKTMEKMHGMVIDGSKIEVTLAKPASHSNNASNSYNNNCPTNNINTLYLKAQKQMNVVANPQIQMGHFLAPQAYFPVTETICYDFNGVPQQEMLRNRNPTRNPSQQYSRKAGGMARPYGNKTNQVSLEHGNIQLIPVNSLTFKSMGQTKSPVEVLHELCLKNNWALPVYHLHQVHNGQLPNSQPLFIYKLTLPSISNDPYMPKRLSHTVDEAMKLAAEYALSCLRINVSM